MAALYAVTFETTRWRIFSGSALLGAAIGLKLTNIFFAPAFLGFVLVALGRSFWSWRVILQGVGGAVAGGALLHGYWGWLLWQEFGNPIFPFANSFFHSPDFPFVSIHDGRFQLGGVKDLLLLPPDDGSSFRYLYGKPEPRFANFSPSPCARLGGYC